MIRPSRGWPISAAIAIAVVAFVSTRILRDRPPLVVALFSVALVALLILGVLLHEFGHLVAARMAGQRVLAIRFDILGGRTDIIGRSRGPARDAAVAAAGPAVSVVLAALAALLATIFENRSLPWLLLMAVALINALLAVFNLLPALPLDGGEILRSLLLAAGVKHQAASRAVLGGSMVIGAALLVAAVWVGSRGDLPTAVVLVGIGIHLAAIAMSAARHERLDAVEHPARDTAAAATRPAAAIVLMTDTVRGISSALTHDPAVRWLLVDNEGEVVSVWSREELHRILSDRTGAPDLGAGNLPIHPPGEDDRTA